LVLLTVKVHDTQEAAQGLAPHVLQDVPLLIVQNGVGGEELAQQILKQVVIISGVLTLSISILAPGRVRLETTRGGLSLAPTREGQDVDTWAELFASAGMKTATYRDYRALKWSKLLLNMQANAIPAILDMTPWEVFAEPALFALERSAFLEALGVMRALHLRPVSFPGYPTSLLVWAMQTLPASLLRPVLRRLFASGRGDKKPSLQIDLARRRQRSEVVYLNGAVVTYAERVGLDVPVNKTLLDTLMAIAAGNVSWDEFRGQPQKLIAAVQAQGE
jgi:2-dehydropantoate 2-reductase